MPVATNNCFSRDWLLPTLVSSLMMMAKPILKGQKVIDPKIHIDRVIWRVRCLGLKNSAKLLRDDKLSTHVTPSKDNNQDSDLKDLRLAKAGQCGLV